MENAQVFRTNTKKNNSTIFKTVYTMDDKFFIDKGRRGLANIGATCYLNTAIQCLSHCKNFLRYVLSSRYKKDAQKHSKNISDDCSMNKLRDVLIELWMNNNAIAPRGFVGVLQRDLGLEICQQNDINEFIALFISRLNSDVCYNVGLTKQDLINNNNYSSKSSFDIQRFKMDVSWLENVGKEYSDIIDLFYSQSIMQIICGHCNKISHNYEIHSSIMLPINEKTHKLSDCIKEYMMEEHLNDKTSIDSVSWTCDECKHCSKSKKTTKLWRNPKILIMTLKRFTSDLRKNEQQIEIPESIDLESYTITKKRCKYVLQAVAMHYGSFFGGHYIAICKHPDNKWYLYDDLNVSLIGDSIPNVSQGYMYFYVLCGE